MKEYLLPKSVVLKISRFFLAPLEAERERRKTWELIIEQ